MLLAATQTTYARPTHPFEAQVRARVEAELPQTLVVKRVQLLSVPRVGRSQNATFDLAIKWRRTPSPGAQTIAVTFTREDAAKTVFVRIELVAKQEVVRTLRDLAAGVIVGPEDVELTLVEVPASTVPVKPNEVVGSRVLHEIAKGTFIQEKDVALAPAIPRGTSVKVLSRSGGVEVEVQGKLERACRSGVRVPIRLRTGRIVHAHLVDPTTAVVE